MGRGSSRHRSTGRRGCGTPRAATCCTSSRATAARDRTARVWDVSWGTMIRREELIRRVCTEKLRGARTFAGADTADPVLSGFAGTDPCKRVGPLSLQYWLALGRVIWALVAK